MKHCAAAFNTIDSRRSSLYAANVQLIKRARVNIYNALAVVAYAKITKVTCVSQGVFSLSLVQVPPPRRPFSLSSYAFDHALPP